MNEIFQLKKGKLPGIPLMDGKTDYTLVDITEYLTVLLTKEQTDTLLNALKLYSRLLQLDLQPIEKVLIKILRKLNKENVLLIDDVYKATESIKNVFQLNDAYLTVSNTLDEQPIENDLYKQIYEVVTDGKFKALLFDNENAIKVFKNDDKREAGGT